jgi:diaminohydroxyphosphoribosylaminopyrimidine deaminase/5-amino-6-(5-phosphoribosylamino)uracil reductase
VRGIAVTEASPGADGLLSEAVRIAGGWGINSFLVEGGGGALGGLFDSGLVDRVAAFVAPIVVGGAGAPSSVAGLGVAEVGDAWRLAGVAYRRLGGDLLLEGRVERSMVREGCRV